MFLALTRAANHTLGRFPPLYDPAIGLQPIIPLVTPLQVFEVQSRYFALVDIAQPCAGETYAERSFATLNFDKADVRKKTRKICGAYIHAVRHFAPAGFFYPIIKELPLFRHDKLRTQRIMRLIETHLGTAAPESLRMFVLTLYESPDSDAQEPIYAQLPCHALAPQTHSLGERRTGLRIVWRHHRVVAGKIPFLTILLWRQIVMCTQVTFQ